jgi:hypothetical protein
MPLAVVLIVFGLWFLFRGFFHLDYSEIWGGFGLPMGIGLMAVGIVV